MFDQNKYRKLLITIPNEIKIHLQIITFIMAQLGINNKAILKIRILNTVL